MKSDRPNFGFFFRSKISQCKCDCDSETASQESSAETYKDSGAKGDQ